MKSRLIFTMILVVSGMVAGAQDWIGNQFQLDTIVKIREGYMPSNVNMLKCKIQDGTFYFIEQLGFHYGSDGNSALVRYISLKDYSQGEIVLTQERNGKSKVRKLSSLWVYDLYVQGDTMLVTTQDELLLFVRIDEQNYVLKSTFCHKNLCMAYLNGTSIDYFEEDHDSGYKWFRRDLQSDSEILVRELKYEAPHIVQIQPNRYLFHNQNNVFFLSTRYPVMDVFRRDGSFQKRVFFDLPTWKAFDDDYIRKAVAVPYGIERIYAVKDDIYSYSYPKVAMPIGGDYVLFYMQFDSIIGKSVLQYAIYDELGKTIRYIKNNHENSRYVAAQFPFDLFSNSFDKGNAADDEYLVQLTYFSDVKWRGKTNVEYKNDVDNYFEDHEPILAYKIMRRREDNNAKEQETFENSVKKNVKQKIYMLHDGPECSGCVKAMFNFFENCDNVIVDNVYFQPMSKLQQRELKVKIAQDFGGEFSISLIDTTAIADFVAKQSLNEIDFPAVVTERDGKYRLFKVVDIFTDDNSTAIFKEQFQNEIQYIVRKQYGL